VSDYTWSFSGYRTGHLLTEQSANIPLGSETKVIVCGFATGETAVQKSAIMRRKIALIAG